LQRLLVAHHFSHKELKEEQEAEALMNGSGVDAGSSADCGESIGSDQQMSDRGDSEDDDDQGPRTARAAKTSS